MEDRTASVRTTAIIAVAAVAILASVFTAVTVSRLAEIEHNKSLGAACMMTGGKWLVDSTDRYECQR